MSLPRSLQEVSNGWIINRTAFGHAFQVRCRQEDMFGALAGCGFFDGGCLSLALAVRNILGADQCRIRFIGRDGRLDHAVAEIGISGMSVFLDADGIGLALDLLMKMRNVEGLKGPLTMHEATLEEAARAGIVDGEQVSLRLAELLRPFFGTYPDPTQWLVPRPAPLIERHRRLIVHDGEPDPVELESLLHAEANTPPQV